MRFSKKTNCFYPEDIGYTDLPSDLIDVKNEDFVAAMERAPGDTLDVSNGRVIVMPKPALTFAELKVVKWKNIKDERDRRKAVGVKVGTKWFHSDDGSRIQQMGLVMLGSSIPTSLKWNTMDGSFVEMTPTLASEIVTASSVGDQAIFAAAEKHKAELEKSEEPENYDYSTGWPEMFQEN